MERRFLPLPALCLMAIALPAPAAEQAQTPAREIGALRVAGNDFPELMLHVPAFDATGNQTALACGQVRAKRIDELDPLWKRAVERIHLDCENLTEADAGFETMATVATAYLKPGAVVFADVPVAEVRLMDSDLWSDHQYVLERPYAQIREILKQHVQSRCLAQPESPDALVQNPCAALQRQEGVYLHGSEGGGVWIHPEQDHPARTIYAEAWGE